MWVAPTATGLRFIYLGMEAGTQETQQDSNLALEAADIAGNIKLLCHISNLKWKLDHLHSHAFTLTLFPVSVLVFSNFLIRLKPICDYISGNSFSTPKRHHCIKSATRSINASVDQWEKRSHCPPSVKWTNESVKQYNIWSQELHPDFYLFFIQLSFHNNLFSVTPFMILHKQKL